MRPNTISPIPVTNREKSSYGELLDWAKLDPEAWPENLAVSIAGAARHTIRYRVDHDPAHTIKELNPIALEMLEPFLDRFDKDDLHVTGSWVGGWWTHPDHGPQDKLTIRRLLGKPLVSDIDLWTLKTPRVDAEKVIREVVQKTGVSASWVSWWGPALPVNGSPWRPCNMLHGFGKYGLSWDHLNASWFARINQAIQALQVS